MLRSFAKRLPHPLLCRLYHYKRLREESARAGKAADLAGLPLIETLHLPSLRTSDTLFVLGSAWSINNISSERWQIIARHDSVGINFWPVHPFVPRFYHFESITFENQPTMFQAFLGVTERRSADYASTLKIITELAPTDLRQTLFELPEGMKKNLYVGFSMPVVARNEGELRSGIKYMCSLGAFSQRANVQWLFKYGGSVIAMMTLAVLLGHKRIVLCGVDLNNQDYFYHDRDRYPECADWEFVPRKDAHLTTRRLPWLVPAQTVIQIFKELVLDPARIELYVESGDSTLYPSVPLASPALFDELALAKDIHRVRVSGT